LAESPCGRPRDAGERVAERMYRNQPAGNARRGCCRVGRGQRLRSRSSRTAPAAEESEYSGCAQFLVDAAGIARGVHDERRRLGSAPWRRVPHPSPGAVLDDFGDRAPLAHVDALAAALSSRILSNCSLDLVRERSRPGDLRGDGEGERPGRRVVPHGRCRRACGGTRPRISSVTPSSSGRWPAPWRQQARDVPGNVSFSAAGAMALHRTSAPSVARTVAADHDTSNSFCASAHRSPLASGEWVGASPLPSPRRRGAVALAAGLGRDEGGEPRDALVDLAGTVAGRERNARSPPER